MSDDSGNTIAASICESCGLDHNDKKSAHSERNSWAAHEDARAKHAGGIPPEAIGPLPAQLGWSLYRRTNAYTCERFSGSLEDLGRHLEELNRIPLPDDRKAQPYVTHLVRNNGQALDRNLEARHVEWFDCDEAGTPDALRASLIRAGVAAIIAHSKSRKETRWHIGVPLTQPRKFLAGELEDKKFRDQQKFEYRHVAAILSKEAGFKGVGGHCGFDLATDRLVQPIYPAFITEEGQEPLKVEVLPGRALDWDTFLVSTGYDYEKALAAEKRQGGGRYRKGGSPGAKGGKFTSEQISGPTGKALAAINWLGTNWKGDGVPAKCPFQPEKHEWDAVYFPDRDHLWCAHNSCRNSRQHAYVDALPKRARDVYETELARADQLHQDDDSPKPPSWMPPEPDDPPPGVVIPPKHKKGTRKYGELHRLPKTPAVKAWLEKDRPDVDSYKVLGALVGTLLRFPDLDQRFVIGVAASRLKPAAAKDMVRRTALRLVDGKPTSGSGWLRKNLGNWDVYDLLLALLQDSGLGVYALARKLFSGGRVRGEAARWSKSVARSLTPEQAKRCRGHIERVAWCGETEDQIKASTDKGEVEQTRVHVCEGIGCGCWIRRVGIEAQLLENGWDGPDGKVWGWKEQSEHGMIYVVHKLTGIPSKPEVELVLRTLERYAREPKLKLQTVGPDGTFQVLIVTNDARPSSAVSGVFTYLRDVGYDYTTVNCYDPQKAINEVSLARLRLHVHHRGLIESRDRETLIDWASWLYRRKVVTKSKRSLPFPSREVMRAAASKEQREELGEVYDMWSKLVHRPSGTVVHQQPYPHTFDQAWKLTRHHPSVVQYYLDEARHFEEEGEYKRIEREYEAELRRGALALA